MIYYLHDTIRIPVTQLAWGFFLYEEGGENGYSRTTACVNDAISNLLLENFLKVPF